VGRADSWRIAMSNTWVSIAQARRMRQAARTTSSTQPYSMGSARKRSRWLIEEFLEGLAALVAEDETGCEEAVGACVLGRLLLDGRVTGPWERRRLARDARIRRREDIGVKKGDRSQKSGVRIKPDFVTGPSRAGRDLL